MDRWKFIFAFFWLGGLAFADLRCKRVPIWLLAIGGIFVTCMSLIEIMTYTSQNAEMVWGLLPGILLLFTAVVSKKAGWADGIVLLLLGALAGGRECAISFVLSLIAISVVSLVLLTLHKVKASSKIPYLPFLWMGYVAQAVIGVGG